MSVWGMKNEDILNALRGYPQRLARISSSPCEDIVTKRRRYQCGFKRHLYLS